MTEEASSFLEDARRIARKREEEYRLSRDATNFAASVLEKAGKEGIHQNTLIDQVQAGVTAPLEVAAHVVEELHANGMARLDRQTGVLYPT